MKKILLVFTCILVTLSVEAQNDKLIGKWNVFEMFAEGKTFTLEQLKGFGMGNDYLEIMKDGTFVRLDKGEVENGTWEYIEADNNLNLTFIPSEEAKARGEGGSTAKYTVEEVNDAILTIALGTFMTTKHKKAVE